jgi:hypothetical protein
MTGQVMLGAGMSQAAAMSLINLVPPLDGQPLDMITGPLTSRP